MISALLALALIGQCDPADLATERAVEESVHRWTPAAPPEPYRSLFARMGSPKWREREAASKAMIVAGDAGRRWLWHGRLSRDPEVAVRSNAIIRRLTPCGLCKGSGHSRNWDEWPCYDCSGRGTGISLNPWD